VTQISFLQTPRCRKPSGSVVNPDVQSAKVYCLLYHSAFRSSQRMQYSGFLRMRSESDFANSYGGPRLSRRGEGVNSYIRNRNSVRIDTKVEFYT
jgi:hypothetical protein